MRPPVEVPAGPMGLAYVEAMHQLGEILWNMNVGTSMHPLPLADVPPHVRNEYVNGELKGQAITYERMLRKIAALLSNVTPRAVAILPEADLRVLRSFGESVGPASQELLRITAQHPGTSGSDQINDIAYIQHAVQIKTVVSELERAIQELVDALRQLDPHWHTFFWGHLDPDGVYSQRFALSALQ